MRAFEARHAVCARARQWASLRLDGELSQLEEALLQAHLASCAQCAAFVRDAGAATVALRGAELERPASPVAVPGRSRTPVAALRALTATAAVVVGAVGFGALFATFGASGPSGGGSGARVVAAVDEQALLREPRVLMRPGVKRGIGISV